MRIAVATISTTIAVATDVVCWHQLRFFHYFTASIARLAARVFRSCYPGGKMSIASHLPHSKWVILPL
ncbi:hypothetical protein KCP73_14210 [Salmonella enterica subsp. enterica]|nr:hypothetical protein KCP73_14210 [Salmonella enterica subsp. enterica]